MSARPGSSRIVTLAEWPIVGLCFAVLTVVAFWPLPVQWLTHTHAHHDALFNMWRLSWIAEALATQPSRLFDPPIFHPATRVLAFSDAVLLQGLVAAPWLAAGFAVLPVSNIVLLLGPWMSAMGTYLLVRDMLRASAGAESATRWTDARVVYPALVAGAVFGFLPYRVEHLMHLELQWSQWMPLTCWALLRTLRDGRIRDGVLTAGFVLAQFLSCIYYGIFLVLALALVAPLLLLARERARLGAIARALAIGAVVCAGPLVAYSAPYRANQESLGGRGTEEIDTWSATPASFIAAPPDNRLYGGTAEWGSGERRLWPGAIAIVLALAGAWSARRIAATRMFAAMLMLTSALAMGTHTPVYRVVLAIVPALNGLRAPARFGMVAALALAVLAGLGAAYVVARVARGWRRHAVGAALLACLAVEYASVVGPLYQWMQRTPVYAMWLRGQPSGTVVDLPIARAHALPQHEAEWSFYGRTHGHPLANGYSGYYPRAYLALLGTMIRFPNAESLDALRARDVRYVVVHEDRYEPADLIDFDARLRATPGIRLVGRFPDPTYPAAIYEIDVPNVE
ncbi:MAG: hypothetical protein IT182_10600 [Acidobacteria bacterium]|nr:hypothetical protein [Acidobacteriota bacterium]